MVRMRFRTKLLAMVLILLLIPSTFVISITITGWQREVGDKTKEGLLNLVEGKAEYYDLEFYDIRNTMEITAFYIASNWGKGTYCNTSYVWIAPDSGDEEELEQDMKNYEYVMQAFESMAQGKNKVKINLMFLGLENGICFLSDPEVVNILERDAPTFDARERIWYTLAKEHNDTVWTPLYVDVNTKQLVTTISTPLYVDGEFEGVLGFDTLLATIQDDILDIQFADTGTPMLVGRDGHVIVHPEYTAEGKAWNESFEEENICNISSMAVLMDEIRNGSTGIQEINVEGERQYAVFSTVEEINGSLLFLLPRKVVMESINDTIVDTVVFLLLALLLMGILVMLFTSSLTRPLETLQKAAREVAKGNLDHKVTMERNDEMGELSEEFNRMVEELKKARRELEESEERYRSIFEESADVIYISTEDGKIIDMNRAGEKLLGYTREELLHMNSGDLYANREDRERFKKEIEKQGFVKDYEVKLKRKDGKVLDCLLSTTMIQRGDATYYQGVIRDVTQLKETQRQLDMYNSLLRHDISNRNQIVLGCLELLKEEGNLNEEERKLVEKAYEHMANSQQLLKKLATINKIQQKELKRMKLADVLQWVGEKYEPLAHEKGVRITVNVKEGCVMADDLLENVFSNIIENALKHSGCKNIEVDGREEDGMMVLTITDDGEGIDGEIKGDIFKWGVKGKGSKGSGLGLHLVKRIVEGYGGTIVLKEGEKGTTFEIRLPSC